MKKRGLRMKNKPKKQKGFFKEVLAEISENFIFEVIWNIVAFIPRILIRVIKHLI